MARECPTLKIALIQPGTQVQPDTQGIDRVRRLGEASMEVGDSVALVVWPESSVGDYTLDLQTFSDVPEQQEKTTTNGPLTEESALVITHEIGVFAMDFRSLDVGIS